MKLKTLVAVLLVFATVGIVSASGPGDTVRKLATAVANKDGRAFMQLVDLDAMLDAELALHDSDALYSGSSEYDKRWLEDGIASGTLALYCKETRRPGCPWTVDGLKKPLIKNTGDSSAVVAVDNPKGIRTWLALYQGKGGWKVVGVAIREQDAEAYAAEDFQQKREDYRKKRVAGEKAVEKRQAEEALAAERKREDNKARAIAEMEANRKILSTVTLSNVTVTRRTNAGHDGKQHALSVQGTAVNGYSHDVARVRWRLDFMDAKGESIAHITWMDLDMGDKTLRRGVRYQRKWNLSLNKAALVKAGEQYVKGKCTISIRPDMFYVGDAFVSDRNIAY